MISDILIQNWPVLVFIILQIAGSAKILGNMKVSDARIHGEIQLQSAHIDALREQIIKQNSRVSKLEDKLACHLEGLQK